MAEKLVYSFGDGSAEGKANMKNLLGGKGANLAEMCALGLPVPPGFTITTEVCTAYYAGNKKLPGVLETQVKMALSQVEKKAGCVFGDGANPLLVSVRSGARASMPGMMDTVLNLGLNDITVKALAKNTGNERFAYDSYRRFIQMYSDVVLGLDHYHFEDMLQQKKSDHDIELDTGLTADDLKDLVSQYKEKVQEELKKPFPENVHEQLWGAIRAVFDSWMNPRAQTYRKLHDIPAAWGTAVTVQSMVFGNMGDDCATGVAFTRNPSTGEKKYYGEFLINAQGEDVVAGIRTPQTLADMPQVMPQVYKQLTGVFDRLEAHYRDMQDIEFTIQNNKLWMLQTRNGKRTAAAAVKAAVDMVKERLIDKKEAIRRIDPLSLDQLLHPTLDPDAKKTVLATGLPASPGAASGKVVFTAEAAEIMGLEHKEKVILVRIETSPEDIHGMHAAQGILTARGGMTSHAAVVARGMGKPCVSGAGTLAIDYAKKELKVVQHTIREGDIITINGSTGEVMLGEIPTVQPALSGDFETLMSWADDTRTLKIRTNAETPMDAEAAKRFGAEGIGLCRTEHMFFDGERITAMREMIVAKDTAGRKQALAKLLPMQREDFIQLFTIMKGLPVTIRLLDPPLHEFLPHTEEDIKQVAKSAGVSAELVRQRAHELKEQNPMLGHRGCRLGITYPEIYEMQAQAIFEAAAEVMDPSPSRRGWREAPGDGGASGNALAPAPFPKGEGFKVIPEIMIPLVMVPKELELLRSLVDRVAAEVMRKTGAQISYLVGTMIELPRSCLRAGDIVPFAEFFSFGTNDLTQTTLGISRDDSASFIEIYRQKGIVEHDPFVTLDQSGVGELIQIAVERGRKARPGLKVGICGEHGGDPASIRFCQKAGLDYVSCSPYRVPVARLAAAQAALEK
ncbi:MAG: pyruvate, phosphate dikinase [Pseudomonadota bacterium]|nr:pyruvate, phosphate dikinase [Pseudomonadota bacterium]MDE3038215.1 pyruvate, phosphate dikinase [Pseudomonadota bacterium]